MELHSCKVEKLNASIRSLFANPVTCKTGVNVILSALAQGVHHEMQLCMRSRISVGILGNLGFQIRFHGNTFFKYKIKYPKVYSYRFFCQFQIPESQKGDFIMIPIHDRSLIRAAIDVLTRFCID